LRRKREEEDSGELEKENRSLLANYIAGLDESAVDLETTRRKKKNENEEKRRREEMHQQERNHHPLLTLKDALADKKPGGEFINVKQLFRQRFDACVNKSLMK
jgi:hypothetical protein